MNFGFNFDDSYDQATSKNFAGREQFDLSDTDPADGFSKEELLRLLAYCESDLQAKDEVISKLKAERAKFLLHEAKYGKLCVNDPLMALKRDSAITDEILDEKQIGQLYESQLAQLEKLIAVQRKSHVRAKAILAATEKRHSKAMKELELEKERKSRYAEQGDDVLALLEKERNKLMQQLETQIALVASSQEAQGKLERRLEAEKEKHKTMVLFLIDERKQLLVKLHESKLKADNSATPAGQEAIIEQMKEEIKCLRQERDSFKSENKALKSENISLKEVVKGQESDLASVRKNMLSSAKMPFERNVPSTLPNLVDDRDAFVVANRMAENNINNASTSVPRTRLANSSSFPTERSKLPRAPASPARTVTSIASRTPASPTKKMPAMGVSTIRRPAAMNPVEPELQALESAINSMNVNGPNVAPSSPTKRSSSLPRGKSEPRRTDPIPIYKTEPRMTPQMGSRLVPPSRSDSQSSAKKLSGTVKRNGLSALTKAFGK